MKKTTDLTTKPTSIDHGCNDREIQETPQLAQQLVERSQKELSKVCTAETKKNHVRNGVIAQQGDCSASNHMI